MKLNKRLKNGEWELSKGYIKYRDGSGDLNPPDWNKVQIQLKKLNSKILLATGVDLALAKNTKIGK